MNRKITIVASALAIMLLVNPLWAGNKGHSGGGSHQGGSGGHHNGHHNGHHGGSHSGHHGGHHFGQHNHNRNHQYGNYRYYTTPYYYGRYYSSGFGRPVAPQPIVLNNPVTVVTPPTPVRAAEPAPIAVAPELKVAMGDTVRITSEKIRASDKGRVVMKIGSRTRRLEVIDWDKGYAVVEIPMMYFDEPKTVTIFVFNAPGKLANRVDALLVAAQQQSDSDQSDAGQSQYATSRN